jgi:hypothetical protein
MVRSVTLCACMVVLGGCAAFQPDLKVDQAALQVHKLALISFYGPTNLAMPRIGQFSNQLGGDVANTMLADVEALLATELGVETVPLSQVVASPGYQGLPAIADAKDYTAPPGMKPLPDDEPADDAQFAALAKELGVDAVMVIRNYWSARLDSQSGAPYAHDVMHVLVVGSNGRRLWEQREYRDAPHSGLTMDIPRPETVVNPTANAIFDSARSAVLQCFDGFASAWKQYRTHPS